MKRVLQVGVLSLSIFLAFPVIADESISIPPKLPCGTMDLLSEMSARPLAVVPRIQHEGPRELRDAFGEFPDIFLSEHFALKSGGEIALDETFVAQFFESLEYAYFIQVDTMGHTPPLGIDSFYVNVYLENSGENTPPLTNIPSYVSIDPEGFPYIIVNANTIATYGNPDSEQSNDRLMAHEFYHVLEISSGAYGIFNEAGQWYFEAAAIWANIQTYPQVDPGPNFFIE